MVNGCELPSAAALLGLNPAKGLCKQPLFVEWTINYFRKTL
jgi:hypothetical protein